MLRAVGVRRGQRLREGKGEWRKMDTSDEWFFESVIDLYMVSALFERALVGLES